MCDSDISTSLSLCHLLTSNFYPQTPFLTPHLPLENLSSVTDHSTSCVFPLSSTDSQRSHLSTITMILKDKFHSPKIKRTPSKKGKQLQPETAAKSTEKPTNKVCVFVCASRRVYRGKSNAFPPIPCICLPLCEAIVFLSDVLCSSIPLCPHVGFPAGSHSLPVAVAAGCASAGV